MTTGEEETESLVDNLFREVDDHFGDLEREYSEARRELAEADADRRIRVENTVQSSAERFELVSEIASLQAELTRSAEQLDERDRLLAELGERMGQFEAQIAAGESAAAAERTARQELLDERREVSRLNALLDARVAERQELAAVAHRLQGEKEHLEGLLATALGKFEQVDLSRIEMAEKLANLEAARESEAFEFQAREEQVAEAKAEAKRLGDLVAELTASRDGAEQRAEKSDGLVERRTNEIGYLKRRLEAVSSDAGRVDSLDDEIRTLERDNTLMRRRVTELESALQTQSAEAVASAKAVEVLAERSSERDEFAAKVAELEQTLDRSSAAHAIDRADPSDQPPGAPSEFQMLTSRVQEMGARRSSGLTQDAPSGGPQTPEASRGETEAPAAEAPAAEAGSEVVNFHGNKLVEMSTYMLMM